MKDKAVSLIIGFVLSLGVVIGAMYFFTKPDSPTNQTKQNLFSQNTVNKIKDNTTGLENFGNLPISVGGDQLGRGNPFESYK